MTVGIDIVVFDGVDEMDALGPLEVFRNATKLGADLAARLVSLDAQPLVVGSAGVSFAVDGTWDEEDVDTDVLLVPGGGWISRSPTGAWAECQRGLLPERVAVAARTARLVTAVCTGGMVLARAGLVQGRRATTHHGAHEELSAAGAVLVTDRVVDDGDLVTCGGVTSGLDLALWVVEREVSAECAGLVAAEMEYSPQRPRGVAPRS